MAGILNIEHSRTRWVVEELPFLELPFPFNGATRKLPGDLKVSGFSEERKLS